MTRFLLSMTAALSLAACAERDNDPVPDETQPPRVAGEEGEGAEPVSIIRDDVRAELDPALVEEEGPLRLVVGFPEGGAALDADAQAALDRFLDPDWVGSDAPVYLWGHSDTVGSDAANFRAGEARARAVADVFEANGVRPERITIVSLGEGNPAQPNYLPDGSDNEEGQRANRRVEIQVGEMPEPDDTDVDPTRPAP